MLITAFLQVDRPVRVERGHVDNSWIGPQLYHIWGSLQAPGGTEERKENPGNMNIYSTSCSCGVSDLSVKKNTFPNSGQFWLLSGPHQEGCGSYIYLLAIIHALK
jgi:hypothetical protein